MPLVLLASDPGMLGRGPCLSPPIDPMDDTRLALDDAVPVNSLALRAFSFSAECMALRSLRASMPLGSESDPDPDPDPDPLLRGGAFSSRMVCSDRRVFRDNGRDKNAGGERLPV